MRKSRIGKLRCLGWHLTWKHGRRLTHIGSLTNSRTHIIEAALWGDPSPVGWTAWEADFPPFHIFILKPAAVSSCFVLSAVSNEHMADLVDGDIDGLLRLAAKRLPMQQAGGERNVPDISPLSSRNLRTRSGLQPTQEVTKVREIVSTSALLNSEKVRIISEPWQYNLQVIHLGSPLSTHETTLSRRIVMKCSRIGN